MNIFVIAGIIFCVLVGLLFIAINQMADAGKKAEELANKGRYKLLKAQENSLSSQVEIRRLNKMITELRRKGSSQTATSGGTGVQITNRKDALEVLGLEANFTQDDLKTKHRQLSKKVHPDVQGTGGLFIVVNSAYELLKE